jgi:molybdopterin molybdotransferase
MIELEEAQKRILDRLPPARPEVVALEEAAGRVLSEPLVSGLDLPGFDNSAMDGFAVRSSDLALATLQKPLPLRLIGKIRAGTSPHDVQVGTGDCVRVFTGSALPDGCDAVVMQEETVPSPGDAKNILFYVAPKAKENIRFRGEDVKVGSNIGVTGVRIGAGRLALLAASGAAKVSVGARPKVAFLATGSELRAPGTKLEAGQIYDSNRVMLASLAAACGAIPKVLPVVPDEAGATRKALADAFAEADMVVTSGGVSVGELDLVKAQFAELGGTTDFWKVSIRPGRPFVFGEYQNKFLFGLPGNPVSAFVTFLLLVRSAILRWQGQTNVSLLESSEKLAETLTNKGDRRHFVRVRRDEKSGGIKASGTQASHTLSSLANADGLVDVPPKAVFTQGQIAKVLRWEV